MKIKPSELFNYLSGDPRRKLILDILLSGSFSIAEIANQVKVLLNLDKSKNLKVVVSDVIDFYVEKCIIEKIEPDESIGDRRVKGTYCLLDDIESFLTISTVYMTSPTSLDGYMFLSSKYGYKVLYDKEKLSLIFLMSIARISNIKYDNSMIQSLKRIKDEEKAMMISQSLELIKGFGDYYESQDEQVKREWDHWEAHNDLEDGSTYNNKKRSIWNEINKYVSNSNAVNEVVKNIQCLARENIELIKGKNENEGSEFSIILNKDDDLDTNEISMNVYRALCFMLGGESIVENYYWILRHSPSAFSSICLGKWSRIAIDSNIFPIVWCPNGASYRASICNDMYRELSAINSKLVDMFRFIGVGTLSLFYHSFSYDVLTGNLITSSNNDKEVASRIFSRMNKLMVITNPSMKKDLFKKK